MSEAPKPEAPKPKLKRFYKTVSTDKAEQGWRVLLDGKPIRTPGKGLVLLPTEALAKAVAAEWDAQGDELDPLSMPMMQFASTALDYVEIYCEDVLDELVEYATTDALCYRAEEPLELVLRQRTEWQPHLDWLESEYGIHLKLAKGVMPVGQEEETLDMIYAHLLKIDNFPLTVLWLCTRHCGSLTLGLSVTAKRLSPLEAYHASRLEERFQNERWGEDDEARARRESTEKEMQAIGRFLAALG